MTPEQEQKLDEVYDFIQLLKNSTTIPFDVGAAFKDRMFTDIPEELEDAPLAAITAPTGGVTIDSQARTAINDVITALEELGLVTVN